MQFGLLVALLLIIQGIDSQVTFTGDAVYDFFPARLSQDAQKAYLEIYNGPSELGVTAARMRACKNLTTGWDVESVYMQYDYFNDILFVGVNCFSTCGDPDGDGFPMTTLSGTTVSLPAGCPPGAPLSAPKLFDYYNYAGPEALSLVFWPEPPLLPSDYQNLGNLTQASKVFYPTFVVGVKTTGIDCTTYYKIFTDLDAYIFQEDDDCVNLPTPYPSGSACEASHAARINVPINSFADVTVNQQSNLAGNAWSGRNIPALTRFATLPPGISKCTTCDNCTNTFLMYPNITMPDVEFSLQKFSKYYNFSFIPGIEPIEFAFMLYTGSPSDGFGEEIVFPALFSIPCTIQDTCGVCNGDNSTCKDCHGIVLGTGQYDRCGICDGANACVDCANITNGNTKYDRCGVCGGNNDCVDCANITFGTAKYDRCGVCNGNNACVDCANVTFGTSKYDRCGVCNGNNSCVDCANVTNGNGQYDRCGVCNGNNGCVDCANVTNGNSRYDRCGVCNGNNACVDCANNTNGNSKYDRCGVCNGNNGCVDCANITNGNSHYDRCGVCNGNNACVDCANVTNGNSHYDRCGVCGGNNGCVDCANITNGNSQYDRCGVCNGNNGCVDCANITRGNGVYDQCGVCNGNDACIDCTGTPGNRTYDLCGVCAGNNSCIDCLGRPHGEATYDRCGVCNGNDACLDCLGVINGTAVYDRCGVCDGNNASIYTFEFEFNGDDSWIELANRTANHGCDDTLHVAWNRSRTVINFDDIRETIMKHGGIFNQTEILNATIFMNLTSVTGGWNDSQLAIHMIDGQFTESEVSWECRDVTCPGCCDQWRMISLPPIVKADFERVPTELKNVTVGQTGTIGWNVTSDVVKYFQEGPTCGGISWLIKKHCEYDPGYATFCSGEGGCCPTLKIYVRSTCPLPPTPQPTPPCPDQEQLYQAMP